MDKLTFKNLITESFENYIGIRPTDMQIDAFYIFMNLLIEKNKVMNLTAITDENEVIVRHFVDSCMMIKFYKDEIYQQAEKWPVKILDIGTGAGFPGLPLAIMMPEIHFTLTDSLGKRINFLKEVIDAISSQQTNSSIVGASPSAHEHVGAGQSAHKRVGASYASPVGQNSLGRDSATRHNNGDFSSANNSTRHTNYENNKVSSKIEIGNTRLIHMRAEDFCHDTAYREKFDFVVARGVAKLSVLAEYCLPALKVGGKMIAYKMNDIESELSDSQNAIKTLGAMFHVKHTYDLISDEPTRALIEIEKTSKTPNQYPRKAGMPSKTPL